MAKAARSSSGRSSVALFVVAAIALVSAFSLIIASDCSAKALKLLPPTSVLAHARTYLERGSCRCTKHLLKNQSDFKDTLMLPGACPAKHASTEASFDPDHLEGSQW